MRGGYEVSKLIFIGVDGGSLDLVLKWRKQLKGFDRLLSNGEHGILRSTVPPITCPAWPSMFTGLNPAELNMYYFIQGDHINTFNDWYDRSVFAKLNSNNTIGLLNVPITYPPKKVNGFMVTGMGTPPGARRYSEPDNILGDGYIVNPPVDLRKHGMERKYAKLFLDTLRARRDAAIKLYDEHNCDLMATVFFTTDMLQHYFWGDCQYEYVMLTAYKIIDDYITYILGNHQGKIIVASDHGFTAFKGIFAVNRWLIRRGYLNLRRKVGSNWVKDVATNVAIKVGAKNTQRIARVLPAGLKSKLSDAGAVIKETESIRSRMEEGSIAYSVGISGAVYVLDKSKTGQLVKELKQEANGNLGVYYRDEVFKGRYIENAPDIMLVPKILCPSGGDYLTVYNHPFARGMHSMDGMYMNYNGNKGRKDRAIYEIHDMIMGAMV